jgi:hypothetical protein
MARDLICLAIVLLRHWESLDRRLYIDGCFLLGAAVECCGDMAVWSCITSAAEMPCERSVDPIVHLPLDNPSFLIEDNACSSV